jgi:hypothetical protein
MGMLDMLLVRSSNILRDFFIYDGTLGRARRGCRPRRCWIAADRRGYGAAPVAGDG